MANVEDARTLASASTVSALANVIAWLSMVAGVAAAVFAWKQDDKYLAFVFFTIGLWEAVVAWGICYGLRLGAMCAERLNDIAITARSAKGLIVTAQARQRAGQDSG